MYTRAFELISANLCTLGLSRKDWIRWTLVQGRVRLLLPWVTGSGSSKLLLGLAKEKRVYVLVETVFGEGVWCLFLLLCFPGSPDCVAAAVGLFPAWWFVQICFGARQLQGHFLVPKVRLKPLSPF